ncbi:MAG: hypothetical protein MUP40_02580 [Actinobacteria bacterium]|nr:hypothetical protein [Actinomycetota bacterium]
MKKDKYAARQSPGEPQVTGVGLYDRQGPIKVSFGVYFISLILVALIIFIVMLVQYFPGYRSYYRLADAVNNANYVYMGIRIPKEELKKRDVNPLAKEDDITKILENMGAKSANCDINPDRVRIPHEP